MFRPHYDRHLIDTLLGRNHKKTITEEDYYMLDRPYMNAVDLEILPRLASSNTSNTFHSASSRTSVSPQRHYYNTHTSSSSSHTNPSYHYTNHTNSRDHNSSSISSKFDELEEPVYLPDRHVNGIAPASLTDMLDTEALLRLKWMDNTPRMSRLRETRRRRLVNKLEVIFFQKDI